MSAMRASLWPGLVAAAATNASRQQDRVRLFEAGKTFHGSLKKPVEIVRIAGLAMGTAAPEQWGIKSESVDFFDIKADVEAILMLAADAGELDFKPCEHPALQPGQAAEILRRGQPVGLLGKLHPRLQKQLDLKRAAFLFELDVENAFAARAPSATPVSKFPAIRRDIAVIVDDEVSVGELVAAVASTSEALIRDVRIFDIYTGTGIEAGRKSVAIGLILQETSRTLTDDDADNAMAAAIKKLQDKFAAELRD